MKRLLALVLVLSASGCYAQTSTKPEPGAEPLECTLLVRDLVSNVNGCWKVYARQVRDNDNDGYTCDTEVTCALIEGNDMTYVSGSVAWVTDVKCSNLCPLPWVPGANPKP